MINSMSAHEWRGPQTCADCGKPTPPGSIHTCSPQTLVKELEEINSLRAQLKAAQAEAANYKQDAELFKRLLERTLGCLRHFSIQTNAYSLFHDKTKKQANDLSNAIDAAMKREVK